MVFTVDIAACYKYQFNIVHKKLLFNNMFFYNDSLMQSKRSWLVNTMVIHLGLRTDETMLSGDISKCLDEVKKRKKI